MTIDNKNSADVWGGFRVGKRPLVKLLQDSTDSIEAILKYSAMSHKRMIVSQLNRYIIEDSIIGKNGKVSGRLYFDYKVEKPMMLEKSCMKFTNDATIRFIEIDSLNFETYQQALGFNKLVESFYIEYSFITRARIEISID